MSQFDSAFPTTEYDHDDKPVDCTPGLNKLEYFSAKAMQGLLANPALLDHIWTEEQGWLVKCDISEISIEFASQLLRHFD